MVLKAVQPLRVKMPDGPRAFAPGETITLPDWVGQRLLEMAPHADTFRRRGSERRRSAEVRCHAGLWDIGRRLPLRKPPQDRGARLAGKNVGSDHHRSECRAHPVDARACVRLSHPRQNGRHTSCNCGSGESEVERLTRRGCIEAERPGKAASKAVLQKNWIAG